MKTENILNQLKLNKNSYLKTNINSLIKILAMLNTIKSQIIDFDIESLPGYSFGSVIEINRNRWGDKYTRFEGEKMDCERFIIKTKTGTYKQVVPVNCDLYPAFLDLIGLSQSEIKPLFKIDFTRLQTLGIKKSVKFASNDDLRPNMQCFEFTILPDKVKIVATNGFIILKYNIELNTDILGQKTFLIPAKSFTGHKGLLSISFFEDCYIINRQKFNYPEDLKYPNYTSIWPTYSQGITIDKQELITTLKGLKPILNRSIPMVKFNVSDTLKIEAEDLDYKKESSFILELEKNNMPDFKIGFNCNYFLDCLDIIQSNKVTIKTNGEPNKAVLINDDILLMPIKLENYGE